MIEKVITRNDLVRFDSAQADLKYWLSLPADKRIEAVELLRRQYYGDTERLQRVARIIQQG
jgi:hypothetical protein